MNKNSKIRRLKKLEYIFNQKLIPVSFTVMFILAFINRYRIAANLAVTILCFIPVILCIFITQYIRKCVLDELGK